MERLGGGAAPNGWFVCGKGFRVDSGYSQGDGSGAIAALIAS